MNASTNELNYLHKECVLDEVYICLDAAIILEPIIIKTKLPIFSISLHCISPNSTEEKTFSVHFLADSQLRFGNMDLPIVNAEYTIRL